MLNLNPMSITKLNTICFIAQGLWFNERGEELIEEDFEAWSKGPMIRKLAEQLPEERIILPSDISNYAYIDLDEEIADFIADVVECYSYMSERQIEKTFHLREMLDETRKTAGNGKCKRCKIPQEQIIKYAGSWL